MPIEADFLAILRCPRCRGVLDHPSDDRLVCAACRLVYPVRDGIPILLIDEAAPLENPAPHA